MEALKQRWHQQFQLLPILNGLVTLSSAGICCMLMLVDLPGMELVGIGPNWLLIWVVAWSVKRAAWQGVLAGVGLGWVQDGMTAVQPSHIFGLALVGLLTASLQKQRYVQEDFISVAMAAFVMALVGETVRALQFCLPMVLAQAIAAISNFGDGMDARSGPAISQGIQIAQRTLGEIWLYHRRVALSSAILSSLWSPVVYYPLNHWWEHLQFLDQHQTSGSVSRGETNY